MRIFLIEWDIKNDNLVNVVNNLQARGHEIVYWTYGDGKENISVFHNKFSSTIFHYGPDALLGIPPDKFVVEDFLPVGEDVISELYQTESVLWTMKHFERLPGTNLEKRHLFYCYLQYWRGVLDKLKPDVIIFNIWPHSSYSYVIYELAKLMNIKTLMFEYMRVDGHLILIEDYAVGSVALKEEIKRNKNKLVQLDQLSDITRNYYQAHLNPKSDIQPPDIKSLYRKFKGVGLLRVKAKMIVASIRDLTIFKRTYYFFIKKFGDNLHKEYRKLQVNPDLKKKYIYFGLHYQPECSTSPLGGIFMDQILAIQILSASLPSGWLIYVKEHPWQWLISGINYTNFRHRGYYNLIAKLKNVRLVPSESDPIRLIEKAEAVAAISGTGGWEGLMRLKPSLVFGYPWYRDCPGVFNVMNVDTCTQALQMIISGFQVQRQDITNFLYSVDQVSIRGYLEELYREQARISKEENVINLTKGLIGAIENK